MIRKGRRCVFDLHAHLVFVTKYRFSVFNKQHIDTLKVLFSGVCDQFETTLVEFDGEENLVRNHFANHQLQN